MSLCTSARGLKWRPTDKSRCLRRCARLLRDAISAPSRSRMPRDRLCPIPVHDITTQPNEQEERASTPVVPAELDFGDDDAGAEAGVDPAVGWGQCYNCEAPVRASSFIAL